MIKKSNLQHIFRWVFTLFGAMIGGGLMILLLRVYDTVDRGPVLSDPVLAAIFAGVVILFAFMTWLLSPKLFELMQQWSGSIENTLSDKPLQQIFSGMMGLIFGLVIATLITQLFRSALPRSLWVGLSAFVYLMLSYIGASIGAKRWNEMLTPPSSKQGRTERKVSLDIAHESINKILDTSVIIDGRIFDVCKTGFVEGPLVIPQFILAELRHIADSSDPLRRARGRRGLDILAQIQNELDIAVHITDADFDDVNEVDVKLLKLAQQTNGVVVTNDFNLNKVASVTGVKVLNLNELAGALRPVLLPGEEMTVHILREGKEYGQGVGYLDDGTMIVVDNGKRFIGETVDVVVTTVLQTSAGRMIFTKVKEAA